MSSLENLIDITTPHRNRNILTPTLQTAYDSLENGIRGFSDRIVLEDSEEVRNNIDLLLISVLLDNPSVFWIGNRYGLEKRGTRLYVKLQYTRTLVESEIVAKRILEEVHRVDKVLAVTRDVSSICLSVHDYLASTVNYCLENSRDCHTALGALLNKSAVCDGFSAAASLMLNYAGVRCDTVLGKIRDGSGDWHAWNLIDLHGMNAHMDVTNDSLSVMGMISHRLFLLDEVRSHKKLSWMGDVSPQCHFDYYSETGLCADSMKELVAIVEKLVSEGHCTAEIRIGYDADVNEIADTVQMMYDDLRIPELKYDIDDDLRVLSFETL